MRDAGRGGALLRARRPTGGTLRRPAAARAHTRVERPRRRRARAVEAVEQAAGSDEQRLLALDARLELTLTRCELHESLRLGDQAIAAARALGRHDLELRFAITLSGALWMRVAPTRRWRCSSRYAPWVRSHADVEQQWEYWAANALALDYADRLGDAMPAWEAARAVAQQRRATRHDVEDDGQQRLDAGQDGPGGQAAQAAEQAHRLACASNETVTMRVLQMQVTLAHRLRDVGRYGDALALARGGARRLCRASGASHSDHALAEQRLVVLYQQLGQPARALHLLAPERPGVPRGVAMIRLAHRAELEAQMGRDGLALMREALKIIPNADDIFHRIATLFATRLVPADEGEAMAANLALWATARERHGVALSGHVRARRLRARARRAGTGAAARRGGAAASRALPARQLLPARDVAGGRRARSRRSAATPAARKRRGRRPGLGRARSTTRRCRPSSATASCTATRSTAS